MNYEDAIKLSFSVPWKIEECLSGKECWCRGVVPAEPILFKLNESAAKEEELTIIDYAVVPKEYAEYFVELHNKNIGK